MIYNSEVGKIAFELMFANHENLMILGYDGLNCVANAYYRMVLMGSNKIRFSEDYMEDLIIRNRFHAHSAFLKEFVTSIVETLEDDELKKLKKSERDELEAKLKNCVIDTLRYDIDDALNRWEITLNRKRKAAKDFDIPNLIIMMSQSMNES